MIQATPPCPRLSLQAPGNTGPKDLAAEQDRAKEM